MFIVGKEDILKTIYECLLAEDTITDETCFRIKCDFKARRDICWNNSDIFKTSVLLGNQYILQHITTFAEGDWEQLWVLPEY